MIDLTRKALPNTVTVDGKAFSINTDFRVWIRFEIDLAKRAQPIEVGYIFRSEIPKACSIEELLEFARPRDELPRIIGHGSGDPVIDYEYDSDYIYAAFRGQYGIDLLTEDMHWHVFLALIKGLNDSTRMREIMGYRSYSKDTKNVDQYERLKMAWRIERTTPEEEAAAKAFSDLFY